MPIRSVDDPDKARAIAGAAFSARPRAGGLQGMGPANPPEVGALPLYNLTPEEMIAKRLDSAVPTGWRYVRLQRGGKVGEIVEVKGEEGKTPKFASFASGKLAGRMSEAGNMAAKLLADSDDEFEPRVLRLPEIHMEALWFHSNDKKVKDRFFGLPSSQKDLIDALFVKEAIKRAKAYLAQRDAAPNLSPRGG